MASLKELLYQEGFGGQKVHRNRKSSKMRERVSADESIVLPIYICHDRKSSDFLEQKTDKCSSRNSSSVFRSKRVSSDFGRLNSKSLVSESVRKDEPGIDEIAIRAVISILSGYVGQYLSDKIFREKIREKCSSCIVRRENHHSDNGVYSNMELGIESIDNLVENQGVRRELRAKSIRNSIKLLTIVASLSSKSTKNISACAHLYLSIVYKLEKNDRISARHLLQVFCDSPFLARTILLPDLWEYLFLPHLLHLKVWYSSELEFLENSDYGEKEKRIKGLSKVYDDQMDMGTSQFGLYYKEWLNDGVKAPSVPCMALPSRPSHGLSRRRSSDSYSSNSSINRNLYRAVFGPTVERKSMDLDDGNGNSIKRWNSDEDNNKNCSYGDNGTRVHRRSLNQNFRNPKVELWNQTQKSNYFRFFTCQSIPAKFIANENLISISNSNRKEENTHLLPSDLTFAITTICSSDILSDCELAIRGISRAWLDSCGDPLIESAVSKTPVIEGMLEVIFASNDEEILELAISILAEIAAKDEVIRQTILNSDPQLETFMRLLKSSSLFLKAAVLLYILKPKAKQMIAMDWVPLVLRVLEFGDQLQTLFTVQISPQEAAFYFLEQLLSGFDEDRNLENARQVISVGGLSLLARRIEKGDIQEKNNAASTLSRCIQADGNCRNYLADYLNKKSILELIVRNSDGCAFILLAQLLCLNKRTRITKFLDGFSDGWCGLSTMHILLASLQRAAPEEHPLVAAILLQFDLMGEPLRCSIYREEAMEALIAALDYQNCNEKVQVETSKALLMLVGQFSCTGEASAEKWILHEAGLHENSDDSFYRDEMTEEEDAVKSWQKKAAIVLLNSGNKRLLAALSSCMENAIPTLARACLVTVAWMSSFLHSFGDEKFRSTTCSILMPQLLESLHYNKDLEERVLASYSLLNLIKSSECDSMLSSLDKELVGCLQNLSLMTWTANELISIIASSFRDPYP